MDSKIKFIFGKKIKDYTYTILFFLIFSFFLLVVIKPNLEIVFNLQKEREKLIALATSYSLVIEKIVAMQVMLETTRKDIFVLDQALPVKPEINKIIDDINNIASLSGLIIKNFSVSQINLKENQKSVGRQDLILDLDLDSDFNGAKTFFEELHKQRRLKIINNISINKDSKSGTIGGQLKIKMSVKTFYL